MNQLKEAEKKASQLVGDARKARVDRMKEAKTEAEQIISAYRAEMEAAYKSKAASQTGASGSVGNALQSTTNAEIANMGRDFSSKRGGVEQMLIDLVVKVEPKATEARGFVRA